MSDLEILGLETDTELYRMISNDESGLRIETALSEVIDRTRQLVNERGVRCIIFECTNLSAYKATVRAEIGIAVFDLVDLVSFHINALKGE